MKRMDTEKRFSWKCARGSCQRRKANYVPTRVKALGLRRAMRKPSRAAVAGTYGAVS